MPKITGAKGHAARLKFMVSPEAHRQVGAALFAGGQRIEVYAATSITEGSVSGKGHVPSAPGSPPNADTQVLSRSIQTVVVPAERTKDIRVHVIADAPYAAAQEFGTSKLPARPYMAPAAAAERKTVVALVEKAKAHIAKGGKVTG